MGKQGKGVAPWKQSSSYWSYWDGSWKQRSPKAKNQSDQHSSETMTFPECKAMEATNAPNRDGVPSMVQSTAEHGLGGNAEYLKTVQKAINNNRRIEGRLRKITEDLQHKASQWKTFERHLQTVFASQRQQYQLDVEALNKEAADLEQQRVQALQQLMETVDRRSAGRVQDVPMGLQSQADAEAWNVLMQQVPDPQQESDHSLAQALLAAQSPSAFANLLRSQMPNHPQAVDPWAPATPMPRAGGPPPRTPSRRMPRWPRHLGLGSLPGYLTTANGTGQHADATSPSCCCPCSVSGCHPDSQDKDGLGQGWRTSAGESRYNRLL